jgi:hypothetical protein
MKSPKAPVIAAARKLKLAALFKEKAKNTMETVK